MSDMVSRLTTVGAVCAEQWLAELLAKVKR
jgi:hypothetical protein